MSEQQDKQFVREITPKSVDFSQWYVDVVRKAELADYTTIKGCMVIKPYGFALWENIRDALDRRIKATGHENAYFPLFVPESLLKKEAAHVEGFAPEVAWVTHGGNEPLEERLAIRPTSEAIICSIYAKWVQSYRDLPILINQWANVVRWEKVTRLFLRTTEFLWQEGHTCHRTMEEAQEETLKMLRVYQEFAETELAMPVIAGQKTENEKFPGALYTYTIEALMGDGKALQAGTSHNLGQHFSKMFEIMFEDEDHQRKYVWQTSWGVSTRLVGGVIMTHGDEHGLILPPRIAPIQVVIVPIFQAATRDTVVQKAEEIAARLRDKVRVKLDARDNYTPGWKFNEYELRGVPLRLELGPKDIQKNQCVLVHRDNRQKIFCPLDQLEETVVQLLDTLQKDLLARARAFRDENTRRVASYEEFQNTIEEKRGFIFAPWCGEGECELKIKEETKATIRCLPLNERNEVEPATEGSCIRCGQPAKFHVYFARAY
ncbi:Prolyl-tRNA synthetase [Candidatus Sumerlaea chitinivorans]|uniref:Proline--tRNA ligase n=1 Tax=Sumerlaea chitinivorans TaxID=2250252 RepID=A0A2Z4Y199_SUMC1|nr:Prolyl-tRNA synthetase [Candidatus Sumerlaea chitinivorans]